MVGFGHHILKSVRYTVRVEHNRSLLSRGASISDFKRFKIHELYLLYFIVFLEECIYHILGRKSPEERLTVFVFCYIPSFILCQSSKILTINCLFFPSCLLFIPFFSVPSTFISLPPSPAPSLSAVRAAPRLFKLALGARVAGLPGRATFGSTAETKLSRLWDEWAFGTLTHLSFPFCFSFSTMSLLTAPPFCIFSSLSSPTHSLAFPGSPGSLCLSPFVSRRLSFYFSPSHCILQFLPVPV